ncbi:hypothetical protein SteCoe_23235 [Stentor coeruleus]|uniref:Palmitoyltransferase n=1 Tax=Stentor coeruleus TaxID=5963 RepID=A0A1R2BKE5_9CILI|nr:hypothetical protein SteCoe_23235 [Stentor coeruleus]
MGNSTGRRRNGFDRPLSSSQKSSWFLLILSIAISEAVYIPALDRNRMIIFSFFYHTSLISIGIFSFLATNKDPTLNPPNNTIDPIQNTRNAYCSLCKMQVYPNTKHCGQCNRCVDNFDHHCVWFNNCIGNINYKAFIIAIASLLVNCLVIIGFGMFLIIKYFIDQKYIERQLSQTENLNAWFTLLIFLMIGAVVLTIIVGKLFILHLWLMNRNMRMFDYMLLKKKAKCKKVSANNTSIISDNDSQEIPKKNLSFY